jgi:hypothetical protein
MNQALYAHMNNKRKMKKKLLTNLKKKKKKEQGKMQIWLWASWEAK